MLSMSEVHISMDMGSLQIQYTLSRLLLLAVHLGLLHRLFYGIFWNVFIQAPNLAGHYDIYDKIIIALTKQYLIFNAICLEIVGRTNHEAIALMRVALVLSIFFTFLKFQFKQFIVYFWGMVIGILTTCLLGVQIQNELPLLKVTLLLTICICGIGIRQSVKISEILSSEKYKSQADHETFLNRQFDHEIAIHFKNRRSYCTLMTISLLISATCMLDISASNRLIGEIPVSLLIDVGPISAILYNFQRLKSAKENVGIHSQLIGEELSQESQSRASSHILVEMQNLGSKA